MGGSAVLPPASTQRRPPPMGRPYPPKRSASDWGESGVTPAVWGRGEALHTPIPPLMGRPYPRQRSSPKHGDWGVTTAMWGRVEALHTPYPLSWGVPIPHGGLHQTEGIRV